jgi:hypothetical protein
MRVPHSTRFSLGGDFDFNVKQNRVPHLWPPVPEAAISEWSMNFSSEGCE